jgi:hypothetical protein
MRPWPPELVVCVGRDIYKDMMCLTAWQVIPRGSIASVIDAIKNRVLSFILDIEAEAPDAGEAPPNSPPLPQDRVAQVFHAHIYGNVGNITQGSQNVTQTATILIKQHDLDSLKAYLSSLGVTDIKLAELEMAIREDTVAEVQKKGGFGSQVSAWLTSLLCDIAAGVTPILQHVDAILVAQAIMTYYGLQ